MRHYLFASPVDVLDAAAPASRHLADAIPGARLVELEGDDHWLWAGNQRRALQEIRAFVRRLDERRRPAD